MKNKFGLFFVLLTAIVSVIGFACATAGPLYPIKIQPPATPDVKEMAVYAQGELIWYGFCYKQSGSNSPWICDGVQYSVPSIERGENLPIKVVFESGKSMSEIVVKSWINGYRSDIEDITGQFDVFAGYSYSKYLYLDIPADIDAKNTYTLYVEVQDNVALTGVATAQIELSFQKTSNTLEIKNVELYAGRDICSCSTEQIVKGQCGECNIAFEAGASLYADVLVKNMGSQAQSDVFVKMSIPELCIERTVYLGDLGANSYAKGSSADSQLATVSIVLPETAKGSYTLVIETFNDDVSAKVTQQITVAQQTSNANVIVEQTKNDVEQGKTALYSFYVSNMSDVQTFTVSVEGTKGWSNAQVSPAAFSLAKGEGKMVNIQLAVDKEALVADHQFTVKVAYGNEVKTYTFSANVTKASGFDTKVLLLIVGIVLAAAIIVLLALMIAKNSKSKVEKPEEEYSYY